MGDIERWRITAPRSPRRGENWQLECGALDGQVIPAGESVIVVSEQQLRGAVEATKQAIATEIRSAAERDGDWYGGTTERAISVVLNHHGGQSEIASAALPSSQLDRKDQ